MRDFVLTGEDLLRFRTHLIGEEKSAATIEKYLRDVKRFQNFVQSRSIDKEQTVLYKKFLVAKGYAIRSVNSMLASLNSLLEFLGRPELRVKNLRMQRQIYCAKEAELTKEEYMRLLRAAEKRPQLHLIMQTICGTGIRVSELKYFTVEAAVGVCEKAWDPDGSDIQRRQGQSDQPQHHLGADEAAVQCCDRQCRKGISA